MSYRGHDESSESHNPGNFLSLLNLLDKRNSIPSSERLQSSSASYTCPDIQNELLEISAGLVLEQITEQISAAGYCAVLADETKDVSRKEQLSVCVRYLYAGAVVERFVGFVEAKKLDAASLVALIEDKLAALHVTRDQLVAQCYDGAAVMSGRHSGVQARLREKYPNAVYVHCANHCLQLSISDVCSAIPEADEFFSLLHVSLFSRV